MYLAKFSHAWFLKTADQDTRRTRKRTKAVKPSSSFTTASVVCPPGSARPLYNFVGGECSRILKESDIGRRRCRCRRSPPARLPRTAIFRTATALRPRVSVAQVLRCRKMLWLPRPTQQVWCLSATALISVLIGSVRSAPRSTRVAPQCARY